MKRQPCTVQHLGLQAYPATLAAMHAFVAGRTADTVDELWVLQHLPVFTQGQAGKPEHLLDPGEIPVVQSDRGGQVTYHGPGQLVIYFMLDVKRRETGPRELVTLIETSIIKVLADYGLKAGLRPGAPGVYVEDKKIAALGLRIRRGCSLHGLSFNIDMDLAPFTRINPCGYAGLECTQLRDLLPHPPVALFEEARQGLLGELLKALL
jgi:lipoyl(octanoyl) transferase